MIETKVINFYGGPGAGKSTLAGELFGYMKRNRMNCEYVPEFAKELTWRKDHVSLDDQIFVTATQHNRIYTLLGQTHFIITDSPILTGLTYFQKNYKKFTRNYGLLYETFEDLMIQLYHQYDNVNFIVNRGDREYKPEGRNQTEEESRLIDDDIRDTLIAFQFPYNYVQTLAGVVSILKI